MNKKKTKQKIDININDLIYLIHMQSNVSETTVKKVLKGIYKVILKQLELNNRITFKSFGSFEIKDRKSGERYIGDPIKGGMRKVFVRPRKQITFKPSKLFDASVNDNNFEIVKNLNKLKRESYMEDEVISMIENFEKRRTQKNG